MKTGKYIKEILKLSQKQEKDEKQINPTAINNSNEVMQIRKEADKKKELSKRHGDSYGSNGNNGLYKVLYIQSINEYNDLKFRIKELEQERTNYLFDKDFTEISKDFKLLVPKMQNVTSFNEVLETVIKELKDKYFNLSNDQLDCISNLKKYLNLKEQREIFSFNFSINDKFYLNAQENRMIIGKFMNKDEMRIDNQNFFSVIKQKAPKELYLIVNTESLVFLRGNVEIPRIDSNVFSRNHEMSIVSKPVQSFNDCNENLNNEGVYQNNTSNLFGTNSNYSQGGMEVDSILAPVTEINQSNNIPAPTLQPLQNNPFGGNWKKESNLFQATPNFSSTNNSNVINSEVASINPFCNFSRPTINSNLNNYSQTTNDLNTNYISQPQHNSTTVLNQPNQVQSNNPFTNLIKPTIQNNINNYSNQLSTSYMNQPQHNLNVSNQLNQAKSINPFLNSRKN